MPHIATVGKTLLFRPFNSGTWGRRHHRPHRRWSRAELAGTRHRGVGRCPAWPQRRAERRATGADSGVVRRQAVGPTGRGRDPWGAFQFWGYGRTGGVSVKPTQSGRTIPPRDNEILPLPSQLASKFRRILKNTCKLLRSLMLWLHFQRPQGIRKSIIYTALKNSPVFHVEKSQCKRYATENLARGLPWVSVPSEITVCFEFSRWKSFTGKKYAKVSMVRNLFGGIFHVEKSERSGISVAREITGKGYAAKSLAHFLTQTPPKNYDHKF